MSTIRLQARAKADLLDIWRYSAVQFGEVQADAYLDGLDAAMRAVAETPHLGQLVDEIRRGYRRMR